MQFGTDAVALRPRAPVDQPVLAEIGQRRRRAAGLAGAGGGGGGAVGRRVDGRTAARARRHLLAALRFT